MPHEVAKQIVTLHERREVSAENANEVQPQAPDSPAAGSSVEPEAAAVETAVAPPKEDTRGKGEVIGNRTARPYRGSQKPPGILPETWFGASKKEKDDAVADYAAELGITVEELLAKPKALPKATSKAKSKAKAKAKASMTLRTQLERSGGQGILATQPRRTQHDDVSARADHVPSMPRIKQAPPPPHRDKLKNPQSSIALSTEKCLEKSTPPPLPRKQRWTKNGKS